MLPKRVELNGNERFKRLLAGTPETAGMKSGYVTLNACESVGEHKTEAREEAIIVLEGSAEIVVGGKAVFTAAARNLVYIPPETTHDIRNSGEGPLRYVYVVTPVRP